MERAPQEGRQDRPEREREAAPTPYKGCGHFLGRIPGCQEQAVACLELRVSGCLFAELARQQPGAAGCNYALQLQRKLLAAEACAGPGCTSAAGLKGTMEIETGGSREGEEQDEGEDSRKEG